MSYIYYRIVGIQTDKFDLLYLVEKYFATWMSHLQSLHLQGSPINKVTKCNFSVSVLFELNPSKDTALFNSL